MTSKTRTSSTFVWPIMVFILFTGEVTKAQESYQEGVMLLKFTENAMPQLNIRIVGGILETGLSSLDELHRQHQALWLERLFAPAGKFEVRHVQYGLQRWYKMTFSESTEVEELIELYRADSNIASVQLNRKYELFDEDKDRAQIRSAGLPNDPFFANQWHLHNTGQTGGTPDADIDAPEAWDIQSGDPSVIVSVMDTGQDLDHPDLVDNLWVNAGEIPNNGIDDDNNGFIDDINGWDHSDDDNDPDDYHGHGSHTAGTIAAKTNNGIGVAGVAGGFSPGVKIMSNKIFPSAFSDRISLGFHYAADNGAVISSNSWGNDAPGPPDPIIEEAIDYFTANAGSGPQTIAGGVVVFAAGNDNTNDPTWGYPASYAPVIGVAGTNHNDIKASFSNWGTWVDVSAPGVSVYSLLIGGYGFLSGTSMACPHVAGVAALIASQNPDFTAAEVRAQLEATTDNIDDKNPGFEGLLGTGRVNAFTAVGPTLTVPKPPENLLALLTDNDVNLTWNDPTENTDDSPLTDLDHINVYRNGALIAEIAPGVESYDDLDLGNGVYDYFATAVDAEDTQSSPSNTETVIIGQIDALILAPPGVFSAQEIVERAEQVKGQSLTLQQAQSMLDARLQSHSQIEAALTANGIASLTTQDITNFNLFDFQYLFVILGQFPANFVIPAGSAEATDIEDYIAGGGKVYMEGGDVWFFDPTIGGHDFSPTFGINALSDGAFGGELNNILGACFLEGLNFNYAGGDNYPDHIEPLSSACAIQNNDAPQFTCGVANPATGGSPDEPRTIGTSFEFGQLVDGASPATKAQLMALYLQYLEAEEVSPPVGEVIAECVLSNPEPSPGGEIIVTINVDMTGVEPPDDKLSQYEATIVWDPTVLSYIEDLPGDDPWGGPFTINEDDVTNGTVNWLDFDLSGVGGTFAIINFKFEVVGDIGSMTDLDLQFSEMINTSFESLLPILTTIDCSVGVIANVTLIWMPEDVVEPDLALKAQQRSMTLEEAQTLAKAPTSHLELQAALEANGRSVEITNDLTTKNLSDFNFVFVVLGVFPNNHVIAADDPEATQLENYLAGGGRLYMEGADMWFLDPNVLGGHDFGASFSINGITDGADDLKTVLGSCMALGMNFVYKGQNNFIDRISPAGSEDGTDCTVHSNNLPSYRSGVAFDNTLVGYRTIGNSFEFGGLQDNSIPGATTKAELMAGYLDFFDGGLTTASGQVTAKVSGLTSLVTDCPVSFAVSIDVSETNPAENLGQYAATLSWDPTLLEFVSAAGGDPPFDDPIISDANAAAGELKVIDFDVTGAGGEVNVLNLDFNVVGDPDLSGVLDVDFSEMIAAGTFNNLLPIAVTFDADFETTAGCLLGDVTNDDLSSGFDALVIATFAVDLPIPPEFLARIEQGCGDVTLDGVTSGFDALVIATFAVELPIPDEFPVGEPLCP